MVLKMGCNTEHARLKIMELMRIAQEVALLIEERFRRHYELWIGEEERMAGKGTNNGKGKDQWTERMRTVLLGKWKLKKEEEDELVSWEVRGDCR